MGYFSDQEITSKTGNHLGVLKLDINYTTLENYLNHLKLGKSGFAFIINEKHQFVYHLGKQYTHQREIWRV